MNNVLLQNALKIISEMTPEQLIEDMRKFGIKFEGDPEDIKTDKVVLLPTVCLEAQDQIKKLAAQESFFDPSCENFDEDDRLGDNVDDVFSLGFKTGKIELAREMLQLLGIDHDKLTSN